MDYELKEIVDELNKVHAVVRVGKFYVLTEEIDVLGNPTFNLEGRGSFRAFYEDEVVELSDGTKKNKADIWLTSPNRRKYTGIVFDPSLSADPKKYNLWKGFSCKPKKGSTDKYWAHVRDNICNGDMKSYEYIRKWMSMIFQNPDRIHTALVLCGSQGTGKNSFVDPLGVLLGTHFVALSGIKELLSSFNFHLKNAVLIHANEALWSSASNGLGTLKAMITDSLCMIEAKGKDRIMLRNYKHLIVSSNESFPVHLDSDDRRFFVLKVSDAKKENYEYFKAIREELDNNGYPALLHDLLNEDLSSFNPRSFPESDEAFKIKLLSTNSCTRYIYEALITGYFDENLTYKWCSIMSKQVIYFYYKKWCLSNGESSVPNNTFGMYLKKIFPSMSTSRLSQGGKRVYAHHIPQIKFARDRFRIFFKGGDNLFIK